VFLSGTTRGHAAFSSSSTAPVGHAGGISAGHFGAPEWPEPIEPATLGETDQAPPVPIDRAPLTVQERTPLTKLHFLFATCLFAQLFVVRGDRIIGAVVKEDLGDSIRLEQGRRRALGLAPRMDQASQ